MKLTLRTLDKRYSIAQLPRRQPLPMWATPPDDIEQFYSVSFTAEEISIVTLAEKVPQAVKAARNWAVLHVVGNLDFSLTGILADLATVLAKSKVSIFAISTYNTDYLLVPQDQLNDAQAALRAAGHTII